MRKGDKILIGILIILVMGCVQESPLTEEEGKKIAKKFIENSPTYEFDGFNLEHKETLYPEIAGCGACWTFVFEFKSRYAGYGDRTGKMVAQVITPHEAHITVEEGEVTSALLDGKWDMLEQELVETNENRYSCNEDSDCVPEQCCHPTSCINEEFAPSCEGMFCTEECKLGTMDCGCGDCACVNGKCAVNWTREEEWCKKSSEKEGI